ncbi:MAG: hypothetical protein J6Q84_07285 [Kiritimatiellae bacterium]|nr:hypothetical protein [Kiritimatiellia bacterium]
MDIGAILLSIVSTVVAGVLLYILQQKIRENNALKREQEAQKSKHEAAIENGLVCILRKHLMDEHERWTQEGYITPHALENGLAMYKAYKALGGNGMIDHMEEEIQELPIRD